MIQSTTITLSQTELTSILILASEFVRRELKGVNKGDIYQSDTCRRVWINSCNTIIAKCDNALNRCLVANAEEEAYRR